MTGARRGIGKEVRALVVKKWLGSAHSTELSLVTQKKKIKTDLGSAYDTFL